MKAIILLAALFLLTACSIDLTGFTATEEAKPAEQIRQCSPNITIASFNIKDFSDKTRTDEELGLITEVLSNFDMIAVQEVTGDPIIMNRTKDMLNAKGKNYAFAVSEPLGNTQKERYAFIYDTSKAQIIDGPAVYPDLQDEFIREPYYATFKAGEFDFTLMTVHILYGDNAQDRAGEMKKIAEAYTQLQESNPAENDVILTGDFNTQPGDDNFKHLKAMPDSWYVISSGKTTIGSSGHLYDNIIFTKTPTQEYTGAKGIYMIDETMGLTPEEAKEAISDHRPIYAVFCTGTDDD